MKLWIRIALGIAVTAAVVLGNVVSHARQGAAQTQAQTQTPITDGRLTDPAPNLPRGAAVPTNWLTDGQFMRWP